MPLHDPYLVLTDFRVCYIFEIARHIIVARHVGTWIHEFSISRLPREDEEVRGAKEEIDRYYISGVTNLNHEFGITVMLPYDLRPEEPFFHRFITDSLRGKHHYSPGFAPQVRFGFQPSAVTLHLNGHKRAWGKIPMHYDVPFPEGAALEVDNSWLPDDLRTGLWLQVSPVKTEEMDFCLAFDHARHEAIRFPGFDLCYSIAAALQQGILQPPDFLLSESKLFFYGMKFSVQGVVADPFIMRQEDRYRVGLQLRNSHHDVVWYEATRAPKKLRVAAREKIS